MSNSFDIDLDDASVRESLNDLREQYETEPVWEVESGAEYSIYIEFGRGPISAGDNIRGLGTPGPQIPGGISGDESQALRFENEDGEIIYRASVSGHPPYPFFRPAIWEFQANPKEFILDNTHYNSLDEIETTEELIKTAAQSLEAQMKRNATANGSDRSPETHPSHPKVQSGNLRARILARRVR